MTLVFLDTETTSLRHDRRAWEVGLIIRWGNGGKDEERTWFVDRADLDLGNADLTSLKIGGFHDRHPQVVHVDVDSYPEEEMLTEVESITRGATIIGAVPWFDTDVLGQRMRANGICPSWHYHLCDVETLAAGRLRMAPPWDFDQLLGLYGLTYKEEDRHTALGDARMVCDLYDAVLAAGERP